MRPARGRACLLGERMIIPARIKRQEVFPFSFLKLRGNHCKKVEWPADLLAGRGLWLGRIAYQHVVDLAKPLNEG